MLCWERLSSKHFMFSPSRALSTKPRQSSLAPAPSTSPLPGSLINAALDQPLLSAHSSMKPTSASTWHTQALASERAQEQQPHSCQPASQVRIPECCVTKRLAPAWGDASRGHSLRQLDAQLWRSFPADMEPLKAGKQQGQAEAVNRVGLADSSRQAPVAQGGCLESCLQRSSYAAALGKVLTKCLP